MCYRQDEYTPLTYRSVGYNICPKFTLLGWAGISCRVAEGRALGRHGNRIGIIYLHRRCQLSPGNGDHEIRVRENLIRFSRASFPILWKRGFLFTGVFLPGSSRSHRKKLQDEHV